VGYVNHIDRYRLLPRSAEAVRRINAAGFLAFVITNQSGVARGLFDEALIHQVHDTLQRWMTEQGARLDGIYFCPHHPREGVPPWRQDCDCRKPRPGLILRAAREHDVDLASSYMVGDTVLDIEAAGAVGMTSVLVLTGYGKGDLRFRMERRGLKPAWIAADLLEAVEWILEREKSR
jgi:D-glycero-D-manno-heptose 1,7-bisphosphate phosphatase